MRAWWSYLWSLVLSMALSVAALVGLTASPAAAADVASKYPIVALVPTKSGSGYWQVASDGGVFSFGDAQFYGSAGGIKLNQPIVGATRTASGAGYWLVAADGGIFSYGDAQFYGSTGSIKLNQPVVGMAPTPTGKGYWLVAADGGIFSYGDAQFYGSAGSLKLAKPVAAMTATPTGKGYWLVAIDGGVFAYGDARYYGRAVYTPPAPSGYSFVLPKDKMNSTALTAAHHDYPAIDIPVRVGTPFYSITSGIATKFFQKTGCGNGLTLQGDDGAQYTYCHAESISTTGRVTGGQQLGLSGQTGDATGPHLHLQIKYPSSTFRCPQNLMVALFNGSPPPAIGNLPTGGCFYKT